MLLVAELRSEISYGVGKVPCGPREIAVVYRYADGRFTATSPDLTDLEISGRSLDETRKLVRQDLAGFLDPAVKVIER